MFWGRDVILSFWCSGSTRFFFLPELVMGTKSCEFWSSSDTFAFGLEEELVLPGFLNDLKGDADDEDLAFSEAAALSFFVGVLRLRKLPNVVSDGGGCSCGDAEELSEDNVPCDSPTRAQKSETSYRMQSKSYLFL